MSPFNAKTLMKKVEDKDEVLKQGSSIFTEGGVPVENEEHSEQGNGTDTEVVGESVDASPQEVDSESTTASDTDKPEQTEVLDWDVKPKESDAEPVAETEKPATEVKPEEQNPATEDKPEVQEPTATETKVEPTLEFEEASLSTEPNLADSSAFQRLSSDSTTVTPGNESYAELVENMVATQCQLSGVKNLDLTTFGIRAQVLNFPNLSILTYGRHKFLGAPFTEEEENMIIHRLGLHVAQSQKERIVVRAVQEIKASGGMSYYSLLFTDSIAQKFANMFNYVVHANLNESDISKLVLVIQK